MKQSVKQVILRFFLGNYLSRALFLMKQSVKQVILCFFLENYPSGNWNERFTG